MAGGYVCVAGYAEDGAAIRLATPRIHEVQLVAGGQPIIFPSAIIECDGLDPVPQPPHTEDYRYSPASIKFVRRLTPAEWLTRLNGLLFGSVASIFEQSIFDDHGHYIADGAGPRSIGTIRPRGIAKITYAQGIEGTWDFRLGFYDQSGAFYRLKITDFTLHLYGDSLRGPGREAQAIAAELTQLLKRRQVYLRIGLARKWAKFPDRCYLQLNAFYTFPDYLDGKTFADLWN